MTPFRAPYSRIGPRLTPLAIYGAVICDSVAVQGEQRKNAKIRTSITPPLLLRACTRQLWHIVIIIFELVGKAGHGFDSPGTLMGYPSLC
jgi:hypothetical protein